MRLNMADDIFILLSLRGAYATGVYISHSLTSESRMYTARLNSCTFLVLGRAMSRAECRSVRRIATSR